MQGMSVMTICHDWSRVPDSALVSHLREMETAQKLELAALRGYLPEDGAFGAARRTLEMLLTCLERDFEAHHETATRLLALVASIEGGKDEAEAMRLRRLVQRARAGRESILGLLEYADRATAGFTRPWETVEERSLLQALARWDRIERAHLRLEADGLVPRALALVALTTPVALEVRHLEILSGSGGHRRLDTVYCPGECHSVALDWCRTCPMLQHMGPDSIVCSPAVEARKLRHGPERLGDETSVGEAMAATQVSASPDVPAGRIAKALADARGAAAVLVDDALHVLGLVEPAEAAASLGVQGGDLVQNGPAVLESASLADAVAFMVKARRRHLPVVGPDDRAVGVLTDLDALHWIAAHRAH
jgi:CBS domain-containing protein